MNETETGWVSETRVRVRYAETDQMGVVYHANYFVWFEIGRVELMRERGLEYRRLEADEGCLIAVAEATARYRSPARYDDELRVRTHLKEVRRGLLRFGYEVVRETDGATLCVGQTTHVVVGRDMRRRSLPEHVVSMLGNGRNDEARAAERAGVAAVAVLPAGDARER